MEYKKINSLSELEVGKIYSDIHPESPIATFMQLKEIRETICVFYYISGSKSYWEGEIIFSNDTVINFYEITDHNPGGFV